MKLKYAVILLAVVSMCLTACKKKDIDSTETAQTTVVVSSSVMESTEEVATTEKASTEGEVIFDVLGYLSYQGYTELSVKYTEDMGDYLYYEVYSNSGVVVVDYNKTTGEAANHVLQNDYQGADEVQ